MINTLLLPSPLSLWPAQEPEAKPQYLTEDIEKKKHKKPKKITNTHNSITGFEEAFEKFATAGVKNSNTAFIDTEVGNPLTPKQSDTSPDSKLDMSTSQVRFVIIFLFDL